MNLSLSANRKSMTAAGWVLLAARATFTVLVDMPELGGAAWIAVLIGGVLGAPAAFLLLAIRRMQPTQMPVDALAGAAGWFAARAYAVLLALVLLLDAASSVYALALTGNVCALSSVPMWALLGVAALAATLSGLCGMEGVGGALRIWMRLALMLIVVVFAMQLPGANARWLAPILGPGWPTLWRAGAALGGLFSLTAAAWLSMNPEGDAKGFAMPRALLLGALTATLLALLFGANNPYVDESIHARAYQIERMLSSGEASLLLQLPIMMLLYGALMGCAAFEVETAARMLTLAVPKLPALWAILGAGAAVLALCLCGWGGRTGTLAAATVSYPVLTLPLAAICAIGWIRGRKAK